MRITRVGPESAAVVLEVITAAFAAREPLDPPADALSETTETIAAKLAAGGGLLATLDDVPVGALLFDPAGPTTYLRRFAVVPEHQRAGIASVLVAAAIEECGDLTVEARHELPSTVAFWERHGFGEIGRRLPLIELRRPRGALTLEAATAEEMRALGEQVATRLRRGDLLVLSGELGAGKTTFTQGLGLGLGVRGGVTSPTFVIARVHPSDVGGPALVHVDAYRLGGIDELDDLDLDTSLDEAVTVVEWGEGVAEGLADSRLEVRIIRSIATAEDDDARRVEITPVGPRWDAEPFGTAP